MVLSRWSGRRLIVAAVILVGLAIGSGAALAAGGHAGGATGSAAPAWSGTTTAGAHLSLSGEKGHWVVLNFFATWCGPCQAETPALVQFAAANPQARVVGVLFQDSAADARSFQREHGATWPIVGDGSGAISSAYDVLSLPQSFVIAPNGTVKARIFGGVTVAKLDTAVPQAG